MKRVLWVDSLMATFCCWFRFLSCIFTFTIHQIEEIQCCSASQSKNAVSTFQMIRRILYFVLENFLKWLADDQPSSITKTVSTISNIIMYIQPFTAYCGLTRNLTFNERIYYVLFCRYFIFTLWGRVESPAYENGMITH